MSFDWRNEDDQTIEYHFNPRLTVPDAMTLLQVLPERAAAARTVLESRLNIRYGEQPKETLDSFPAANDTLGKLAPAQIFIHGGYWRMMDKSDYSHLAEDVVAAGAAHISLNYDLCPDVTLDDIVDEIRNAVIYIYRNADDLGIDAGRLFIAGHSAGGHLTGMMMRQNWPDYGLPGDIFKGAAPVSGVFETAPIMHTSINNDVHLDEEMAERNNALKSPPEVTAPVLAFVGGNEPEGFHWQSQRYVEVCKGAGLDAEYVSVPNTHHFTVVEEVFRGGSNYFQQMMAQMDA